MLGVTENRNRLILEQLTPRIQRMFKDDLAERVHEHLETSVPAFIESYWQNLQADRLPDLAEAVSKYLYERYFDPALPDSPLPGMVRDIVNVYMEERQHDILKTTETVRQATPTSGKAGVAPPEDIKVYKPEPELSPAYEAEPQREPPTDKREPVRMVYVPQFTADGGRDPGGDGSNSDDDRRRRDRRRDDRRDPRRGRPHSGGREGPSRRRSTRRETRREDSPDSVYTVDSNTDTDSDDLRRGRRHGTSRTQRLRVIRPMNDLFRRAVNYRSYLLRDPGPESTRDVRRELSETNMGRMQKKLITPMKDRTFSGDDPITVLGFLAHYKDACNLNDISEPVAYWMIQNFLEGRALALVQTRMSGLTMSVDSDRGEMLTTYPEVVNFLLQTYATDDVIAEAVTDVENLKQSTAMTEQEYSDELWKRALRCGTVFSGDRLKGYFVEGLLPALRGQVRHYAASHRRSTYEAILRYAIGVGSSLRAMRRTTVPVSFQDRRKDMRLMRPKRTPAAAVEVESEDVTQYEEADDGYPVLALSTGHASPPSTPTTYSQSVSEPRSVKQQPPVVQSQPKTVPGNTRCRICLSSEHVRCPLVTDSALLDQLLQTRERNYQLLRRRDADPRGSPARILQPPHRRPPTSQYSPGAVNIVEEHLLEAHGTHPATSLNAPFDRHGEAGKEQEGR